jgi:hypothetical protein
MRIFLMILSIASVTTTVRAGSESMPSMPVIKEKKVTIITGKEDMQNTQGFGDSEGEVKMMNLMMVEGSGYEGMEMDMGAHGHSHAKAENSATPKQDEFPYEIHATIKPNPPKVGANQLEFTLTDRKTKKEVSGLKLEAEVFMTSMDMGTEMPKVQERTPGRYQTKVSFSMKGPWAVKIKVQSLKREKELNFDVTSK